MREVWYGFNRSSVILESGNSFAEDGWFTHSAYRIPSLGKNADLIRLNLQGFAEKSTLFSPASFLPQEHAISRAYKRCPGFHGHLSDPTTVLLGICTAGYNGRTPYWPLKAEKILLHVCKNSKHAGNHAGGFPTGARSYRSHDQGTKLHLMALQTRERTAIGRSRLGEEFCCTSEWKKQTRW